MLEMELLEALVPHGQVVVVQEVMSQVIADIAKNGAAVDRGCNAPIPVKDKMRELPERRRKNGKESRRHHESVLVHGEVVMNSVEREVEGDADAVVREPPGKTDC